MINVDKNTFLDINLKAINENYKIIKQNVGRKCIIAATVKANAYGLGADQVVTSLIKKGCKYFFVATTNEAIHLRKLNKKIFILVILCPFSICICMRNRVILLCNQKK